MTDRDALLAAICASPDEDTPRLAFADFLDEEGGKENATRAEYIRAAVRLAREERWSVPWRELKQKTEGFEEKYVQLAGKKRLPWVAHLKGRVASWDFERGFVGHITVYSKRFLSEGEKYFAQDPIRSVKFVKLSAKSGSVPPAALFASPILKRCARLSLDGSGLTDRELELLADSPHLRGLRSLSLGEANPFSPSAFPILLKMLKEVRELHFIWNTGVADAHALALAGCRDFARVGVLNLNRAAMTGAGVASLVSSRYASGLTRLKLAPEIDTDMSGRPRTTPFNRPTRKAGVMIAEAIASSKSLGKLRELDLTGRLVGNDGLAQLARSNALPALRELRIGGNSISMDGIEVLAENRLGQQLLYLGAESNRALTDKLPELRMRFPNAHVEVPY
jgi:uncharacterized protein (TIGR02996 family)